MSQGLIAGFCRDSWASAKYFDTLFCILSARCAEARRGVWVCFVARETAGGRAVRPQWAHGESPPFRKLLKRRRYVFCLIAADNSRVFLNCSTTNRGLFRVGGLFVAPPCLRPFFRRNLLDIARELWQRISLKRSGFSKICPTGPRNVIWLARWGRLRLLDFDW